jgi:hypothetical protein
LDITAILCERAHTHTAIPKFESTYVEYREPTLNQLQQKEKTGTHARPHATLSSSMHNIKKTPRKAKKEKSQQQKAKAARKKKERKEMPF